MEENQSDDEISLAPFEVVPCRPTGEIINYTTKKGYQHYKDATAKLQETLYDCEPDGFYQFMKALKDRAMTFGWSNPNGILMIPLDMNFPNITRSLLADYGMLTYETVMNKEISYIDADTRSTQDTSMLYRCIMNSLSDEGIAKLNVDEELYTLGTFQRRSGVCLLKILIRESYLDSNATSSMIRFRLSELDDYLHEIDNDIIKFNRYVKVLVYNLQARGETTNDLLANLFKAYAACSDQTFVRYIADLQTKWEDNEDLTAKELMSKAETKFRILKSKDIWEAPSEQEEKLIALEATISDMKKKIKSSRSKEGRKKGKKDPDQKKTKQVKYDMTKKKLSWMFKRPKDADLKKSREWNGAKWWYCSKETGGKCKGVYRKHHPKDCKIFKSKDFPNKEKDKKGKSKNRENDDEDLDAVVAHEVVNDSPPMSDEDELMGGYESE